MTEKADPLQTIIPRCREGEAFTERLPAGPAATHSGWAQVADGMTVNAAVDADEVRIPVIPPAPARGELTYGGLDDTHGF